VHRTTSATTTSWTFSHARIFIGMPAMSGCVALTSIDLDGNKLTAEGLEPFCSNPPPNLTKLMMQSCGLQGTYLGQPVRLLISVVCAALPDSIGNCQNLTMLYAGSNALQGIYVPRTTSATTNAHYSPPRLDCTAF
jgi:hypothetical protein